MKQAALFVLLAACVETDQQPLPPDPVVDDSEVDLLLGWSGCITREDFDSSQMGPSWRSIPSSNNTECSDCHLGQRPFLDAKSTDDEFFQQLTQYRYHLSWFFRAVPGDVVINEQLYGFAPGNSGEHPHFLLDNTTPHGVALQRLMASASAKRAAGTCGPGTLLD